jgi:hypothetical protein
LLNDYASGLMAPTSGTNSTFGDASRHAQDQTVGRGGQGRPGIRSASDAITIAFSDNQKIPKQASFPVEWYLETVALYFLGWRSRQLPPKWPPLGHAVCRNQRSRTGITVLHQEQGI